LTSPLGVRLAYAELLADDASKQRGGMIMGNVQPANRKGALRWAIATALVCSQSPWALADQAPATTEAKGESSIEEVIVTASRREQRLQDVGISVTPLTEQMLQDLNITTATDIVRAVPSLKMNAYSSSQVVFNVRGVAQNSYGDEQEPPVAVYQDDSYSSSINLASFPVFDLARVETLRGPQGTLFGRNATGGAIQFISHKPTKELEGYFNATYGRFNQQILEGAISGPFSDRWQGRLAFIANHDDGFIKELAPGQKDRGANNHYAVRGQLAWQPTDGTNANLILRYLRANKERQAGLYSHEPACPNAQRQGEFTPPTLSCPFWGSPPGAAGTGFQDPAIIPSRGGDPWATEETSLSYVDRMIKAATLRVDSSIGSLDLVSITDYQKANKFYIEGGDASPVLGVVFYQGSNIKQFSEELRLSGTLGKNRIVGGVYFMKVDGDYTGQFADPFYADVFGDPAFAYIPVITANQHTKSYAVFLQNEWQATDRVSLIAGLRYWKDKRQGAYYGDEPSNGIHIAFDSTQVVGTSFDVPFPENVVPITLTPADADKTFDDVTARLELDFRMNENLLLFTSYNRGSKSGGFSFSTGTPFADAPAFGTPDGTDAQFLNGIPFRPEVLNSFEAGFKSTISGSTTFNAGAFYYDYHDYQAFVQLGVNQTVINLPATAYGLEAELNSQPVTGLRLQVGISTLKSKVEDIVLPDSVTRVEHDLPQAPSFSGNALARYEFPFGTGSASVQADVQYTDKFCFTVLCAPVEKEAGYTVTNARIGYTSAGGRWDVALFGNNLTNEKYRVYAFDSSLFAGVVAGVYAKPRTWGVTLSYHFGPAK
jgi:iron complex outermembrane receptor protein